MRKHCSNATSNINIIVIRIQNSTMAKERPRIVHKLNNTSTKQSRRHSKCRLLLVMFTLLVAVLTYATTLVLNVASNNGIDSSRRLDVAGAAPITIATAADSSMRHLVDRSHRVEIPDEKRTLAFVHVGKSGGSTISLLLRNGCMVAVDGKDCEPDRWKKVPGQTHETIASQRIQFYLHTPHVESGKMAEYYRRVSTVVVVARDPVERFVSAFLCRHPKNIDATRVRNRRARMQAEAKGEEPPAWAKVVWGNGDVEADQYHR